MFEYIVGTDNVHAHGKKLLGKKLIKSIGSANNEFYLLEILISTLKWLQM